MPTVTGGGPMSDAEWRALEDARTLAEAEEIKNDSARMGAATDAAKKEAERRAEEVKNMRKVANKKKSGTGQGGGVSKNNIKPVQPDKKPKNNHNVFKRI